MKLSFNHTAKERAPSLINSLGTAKSRIHLYDYKGKVGKDPYAIYAKKIEGHAPELTKSEKKRFIIQQDPKNSDIYYKINKGSLQKRLKITSKELNAVTDGHYENLIQKKLEKALKISPAQISTQPNQFKPTWEGKFVGYVDREGDWKGDEIEKRIDELTNNPPYSPVGLNENYEPVIKKIVEAFRQNIDGTAFDTAFIHQISRQYGTFMSSEASLLSLAAIHDSYPYPDIKEKALKKFEYYFEKIFYNPKAIIITVRFSGEDNSRDSSIPEDATCAVYTMSENEFKALPRISENLSNLMKEHASKLNAMSEADFKALPKGSERLNDFLNRYARG